MFREDKDPVLVGYPCPITGRPLYNHDHDMDIYDGPSTIKTDDGKRVYEKWPRDWGYTLYPVGNTRKGFMWIPSLDEEHWERAAWNFNPLWKGIPEWKEFIEVCGKKLFLDDLFFEDRKKRIEVSYETERHLRQLDYDRRVASGEITPGPFIKRVVFQTAKIEDVKVCPFPAPSGLLFYMDYKIDEKSKQYKEAKIKALPPPSWLQRIFLFLINIWPFG